MKIEHKGKVLETTRYENISNEQYKQIVEDYYRKPNIESVKNQFISIANGGTKNNEITNYYVKDLMAKTKIYYNKWSIEEVLENKDLVSFFVAKTLDNKKLFPDNDPLIKKIETAMRLGGKGVASKPANFPIKTVDEILNNYNINNNYYDFSCGWGARLTSALKNKINYYGTDPNYLLTDRLNQLANDYKSLLKQNTIVDIRTQGSEIFVPEWENKIGVAFSSPPYFNLEDYKIGNQSYKEGTSYKSWLENYLKPTMQNIYKYVIDTGYFILNINNFKEYKLVEDSIDIAKSVGFYLIGEHNLKNIQRCKSTEGFNDNSERILVFAKHVNNNLEPKQKEQMTLFDFIGDSNV